MATDTIFPFDRPNLVAFRRLIFDVPRLLGRKRDREATALRRRYLGYPANLPDLSMLKPPGGNARPRESSGARSRAGHEGSCQRFTEPAALLPMMRWAQKPHDDGHHFIRGMRLHVGNLDSFRPSHLIAAYDHPRAGFLS